MNLVALCKKLQSQQFFEKKRTMWFKGQQEYPLLFFSHLFAVFKTHNNGLAETLDANVVTLSTIKGRLETTFLGQTQFFWLKNISALSKKNYRALRDYLVAYRGPHSVAFFSSDTDYELPPSDAAHCDVVAINDTLDSTTLFMIADLLGRTIHLSGRRVILKVFDRYSQIPCDTALLLLEYALLAGSSAYEFISNWLATSVMQERSLFQLSRLFFARESQQFFAVWRHMRDDFSPAFWTVFWSEQLWRACGVMQLMREKQFKEAKKVSYRLPFTFMQKEVKILSYDKIVRAHAFLYDLDSSFKNGLSPDSLELFFSTFFV